MIMHGQSTRINITSATVPTYIYSCHRITADTAIANGVTPLCLNSCACGHSIVCRCVLLGCAITSTYINVICPAYGMQLHPSNQVTLMLSLTTYTMATVPILRWIVTMSAGTHVMQWPSIGTSNQFRIPTFPGM